MDHAENAVEDTNAEALVAKLSAIHLGYFPDRYADRFCKTTSKKECIINRGYWARVEAIRMIIERFLNTYEGQHRQIISLGAGYDTFYFNQKAAKKPNFENVKYVEMDLPGVIKRKVRLVSEQKDLMELIDSEGKHEIGENNTYLKSNNYSLVPVDLRKLDNFLKMAELVGIDLKAPTLVFAECVLIYLPTKNSNEIMKYFADSFDTVYFMNWEMMRLKDAFGQVMIQNFEARGYDLLGINEYPDVPSLQKRFKDLGYTNVEVFDMLDVYNKHLNQDERKRIEKIEWLDELEEWWILQKHYYFALCSKIKDQNEQTPFVKIVS
jgi:tRNA wybutosine-synthesizing protein 4